LDKDKLLNILNEIGKKNWTIKKVKDDIFAEYIKDFLKEVYDKCKQLGWKRKDKVLKYNNGKFFLFNFDSRKLLDLGEFNLLDYINKFESNKDMLCNESLKFVKNYPNMKNEMELFANEFIEFMKKRPAFIEKDKLKIKKILSGNNIKVRYAYNNTAYRVPFNIYQEMNDKILRKICFSNCSMLTCNVMEDIAHLISINHNITQAEEDASIKYIVKHQNIYWAKELIGSKRISTSNKDRLNGLLLMSTMNKNF